MGVYLVTFLVFFLAISSMAKKACTWNTFRTMPDCTHLEITGNVSGSIPSEIGDMSALTHLTFQKTALTGTFPADLFDGGLRNTLTGLSIVDNAYITGPMPVSMSSLSTLRSLSISNTPLQGTIPLSFGSCNSLTRWTMDTVGLTGTHNVKRVCMF